MRLPVSYYSRVMSTNSSHTVLCAGYKCMVAKSVPTRPLAPRPG